MNRLTQIKTIKEYPITVTKKQDKKVEIDYLRYNYALRLVMHCNPTDYEQYKSWIAHWKETYQLLTTEIRKLKNLYKQGQREERLPDVSQETLQTLKNFANVLLRERQRMKMFNRFYMLNKDKTNVRT